MDDLCSLKDFCCSLVKSSCYDHDKQEEIEKWIWECDNKELLLKASEKLKDNQLNKITQGFGFAPITEKEVQKHIKQLIK